MPFLPLHINSGAETTLRADAEQSYPDECCGFLYGVERDGIRYIETSVPVHNSKEGDKRRRFEISAKDYLQAERRAEELELSLLGVYHSHPEHPAQPSEHDRIQAMPWFSYIIVSVRSGKSEELNSFQLGDNHYFEQELILSHQEKSK
jgi:proteasome lid subunit RPN8/RPN11